MCQYGRRNGDVQDTGRSRGITGLSRVIKVLERILDRKIGKIVERKRGEKHQGFRKGRGITDGMFMLKQLVEKRLEMQGEMAF